MTKEVFDIGAELELEEKPKTVQTKTLKLLGTEFRIVLGVNYWKITNMLGSADADTITKILLDMIHPADQEKFSAALDKVHDLSVENLFKLINKLIEKASERPTQLPSASRAGGNKRTSPRKSAPSSSRRVANGSR